MKGLLFTYLMTYGGACVSLFSPFYGLLIYICFAIIKPEALWYWSVPAGNYSRIVALALLAGWALQGFGSWRFGRANGIVVALIGFLAWSGIGYTQASDKVVAWIFVESLAKIVLPFLVGITLIDSVQKARQLAWVIVLSQGYVAYELNMSYWAGFNRLEVFGYGGMDNNSAAIGLVCAVGPALFLGLSARGWAGWALALASAFFAGHAVLFSMSRGGMLALIIVGAAAFLFIPKQPKHYIGLILAILLGLRLAGPQVQEEFMTIFAEEYNRDYSAESRLDLWAACLDVMAKQPITGLGPDHWELVAHTYGFTHGKSAHSLWMETGAELGIPGLGLLVAFYGICLLRMWPLCGKGSLVVDPWCREASRMVIASLVGFSVAAQFVTLHGLEIPYYLTLIGAGVLKLNSTFEFGTRSGDNEFNNSSNGLAVS